MVDKPPQLAAIAVVRTDIPLVDQMVQVGMLAWQRATALSNQMTVEIWWYWPCHRWLRFTKSVHVAR